ncbi:TfoX/Sxy family protein [Phenylobacterium terrae]|uniref:TfoX/Sxy family protein n=1 Tax=Phenylobacterium terrae TaxID=2665495 RepID=A0ABW4N4E1_9CAUL
MAVSSEFLDYLLEQLEPLGRVTSRRMFGGAGLYRDGIIFGIVSGEAVYFKTDETNLPDYEAAGAERFDPMPERPAKFSYFSVPPDVLEQPDELAEWARKAVAASARRPAKPAKRPRRPRS